MDAITAAIKARKYGVAIRADMRVEEIIIMAHMGMVGIITEAMHMAGVIMADSGMAGVITDGAVNWTRESQQSP